MKTTQECWQALIDGEKIADSYGSVVEMVNGTPTMLGRGDRAKLGFFHPEDWSIYTPPKWFDNIPEGGVLCWVWDGYIKEKRIVCIDKYDKESTYKFKVSNLDLYRNATPLTKQEIQTLLDNAPEDKE